MLHWLPLLVVSASLFVSDSEFLTSKTERTLVIYQGVYAVLSQTSNLCYNEDWDIQRHAEDRAFYQQQCHHQRRWVALPMT